MPQEAGEPLGLAKSGDIKKLVCKLASSELVEKEAAEEVCKLIKEHFPSVKIQLDCETVASALWDKIKTQWLKGKESLLAPPSSEDIEKLVCKLASSVLVERSPLRRSSNSSRSTSHL